VAQLEANLTAVAVAAVLAVIAALYLENHLVAAEAPKHL
jgi:hypothetical protein